MKFHCIVADPAWQFSDRLTMSGVKRGASSNYSTMSIQHIKALPVKEIADPDGCLLALWVPSSLLQDGMEVMQEWGFRQTQSYVWIKTKKNTSAHSNPNEMLAFGMGRLFRQAHELCLIGINNTAIYQRLANKSQRSVSCEPNLEHSTKPENLQRSLEDMFPKLGATDDPQWLELFARRQRPHWTCLGNAIDGRDIRQSLNELKDGNKAA